jgi:hypothetical protein
VEPLALIVDEPVVARFVMSTRFSARPAPTPMLASTAVSPLAFALASVFAELSG